MKYTRTLSTSNDRGEGKRRKSAKQAREEEEPGLERPSASNNTDNHKTSMAYMFGRHEGGLLGYKTRWQ